MSILAEKATINFGDIQLDCLQFPDGSYHFYINQLNAKLGIKAGNKTGKKYLKPLLDEHPNRVNKARIKEVKSPLKTLSLELVTQAIGIYASIGNTKCQAIAFACMAEALERRADKAFNVQRTEEERNKRLTERTSHRSGYRPYLTDWLKRDGFTEGWQYGQAMNQLKTNLNLPLKHIDTYSYEELSKLNRGEYAYNTLRNIGIGHSAALNSINMV